MNRRIKSRFAVQVLPCGIRVLTRHAPGSLSGAARLRLRCPSAGLLQYGAKADAIRATLHLWEHALTSRLLSPPNAAMLNGCYARLGGGSAIWEYGGPLPEIGPFVNRIARVFAVPQDWQEADLAGEWNRIMLESLEPRPRDPWSEISEWLVGMEPTGIKLVPSCQGPELAEVRSVHDRYWRTENAWLCVAGLSEADRALDIYASAFADLPRRDRPAPLPPSPALPSGRTSLFKHQDPAPVPTIVAIRADYASPSEAGAITVFRHLAQARLREHACKRLSVFRSGVGMDRQGLWLAVWSRSEDSAGALAAISEVMHSVVDEVNDTFALKRAAKEAARFFVSKNLGSASQFIESYMRLDRGEAECDPIVEHVQRIRDTTAAEMEVVCARVHQPRSWIVVRHARVEGRGSTGCEIQS